jgi:RND family efflux transporter MFP subunit
MSFSQEKSAESDQSPKHKPLGVVIFLTLVCVLILSAAGLITYWLVSNPNISKKKDHSEKPVIYVDAKSFDAGEQDVLIEAMGRVIPAQETALKAQVSGEVINVSDAFIPGGYFVAGDTVLNIDPTNYELNLKLKQASLRQAQAELKIEQGQQAIARDELKVLERTTGTKLANSGLALRQPQLEQARSNIATVKTELEIAQIDLNRTTLKAPFNAIITARNTNLGNIVSGNDTLATLVGTDEYWIEAELPSHDLNWLSIPKTTEEKGVKTIVFQSNGMGKRIGHLKNTTGLINETSRLATVIISVADPLLHHSKGDFRLNLNDYVRIEINAKTLKRAYKIPQNVMREGGTVWVYDNGTLNIIKPTIAHEDRAYAYVTGGLNDHAQIITSDIVIPIQGMEISLRDKGEPR